MRFIKATEKYCTLKEHVAAPIFRRSFQVLGEVRSARLALTVTGFYELYVNGKNVTRGLLAPYITNPDHLLYLDSYDIAPYLCEGNNAIALILGNGFANQDFPEWDFNVAPFRSAPKLALELKISASGGEVNISSDEKFKVAPSAILFDMDRFGVIYDARLERDGFSLPDYDDSDWGLAGYADAPLGVIKESRAVPIRVRERLSPISVTRQSDFYCLHFKNGEPMEQTYVKDGYLYDFGVNAAGACRLKIKGERGQKITLRHGESLRDGYFDIGSTVTVNEKTPSFINYLQTDVYYLKGGEEEIFFPNFTYHGFRYAFVEGITPEQASADLLTFEVFNTDVQQRSDFECSDPTLNKLYEMALRADLSNLHHLPTDCPHREKNGWTGDASVSAHQFLLAFDMSEPLGVWLESVRHAQLPSGMLPGIVPTAGWGYAWGSGPAWDAVLINIPYYAYRYDGRLDIIEENADAIEKYLHYIDSRRDGRGLVACGLGDWCQPRPKGAPISAPLEFTDSLQVIEMARKSALMLDAVGRGEASAYAKDLEARMRRAGRRHLIDEERAVAAGECQTSQALAIRFGFFAEEQMPKAYRALLDMIEEKDGHTDCGMIGLRHIFHVLFEKGDADLALNMITREDAPSYGSLIKLGGTALFESLIPNGLNESQNHHFYGDILHLFISKLVGIRVNPILTDINSAVITPTFPKSISHARAGYRFASGRLGVCWERVDSSIRITFSVPRGITARFEWGDYSLALPEGESELVI